MPLFLSARASTAEKSSGRAWASGGEGDEEEEAWLGGLSVEAAEGGELESMVGPASQLIIIILNLTHTWCVALS